MMPLHGALAYGAPILQLLWAAEVEVAQVEEVVSGLALDLAQSPDDARMRTRQPTQRPSETGSLHIAR